MDGKVASTKAMIANLMAKINRTSYLMIQIPMMSTVTTITVNLT